MEFSGLTNERVGMAYIPNAELDAKACSSCGATWERCLQGWPETGDEGEHPMGVCCATCHNTDTHEADAARRRYRERRDAPSGDALDRATKLLDRRHLRPGLMAELVEDIAKLIDAADAAAVTEVKPLVEYQGNALAQIESHDRVALDRHRSAAVYFLERKSAVRLLESAIAELEWFNWRCDGQRVDLNTAAKKLEIADRQRREFLGHSRTANERRLAAEAERDAAVTEARHWQRRVEALEQMELGSYSAADLAAELNRRLSAGEE